MEYADPVTAAATSLRAQLLDAYKSRSLKPPDWAFRVAPSIPFVGDRYGEWGGVLVYASAENLAGYGGDLPDFLLDDRARDRHRWCLENRHQDRLFPHVHMEPFNNGSLLVAAWYLLHRLGHKSPAKPLELLHGIAAANFGKFAISGSTNRDYAGSRDKLAASLPYVTEDLRVLKPTIVVAPKTMLKHPDVAQLFKRETPATRVVSLPQFNATVVNTHLAKNARRAKKLARDMSGTPVAGWIGNLTGYGDGAAWRFLVEMEERIAER